MRPMTDEYIIEIALKTTENLEITRENIEIMRDNLGITKENLEITKGHIDITKENLEIMKEAYIKLLGIHHSHRNQVHAG